MSDNLSVAEEEEAVNEEENYKFWVICSIRASMETRVSAKGQIVIPISLRRKYRIKKGTRIVVTDAGNSIILKLVTEQYLRNLQGSLKGKGGLEALLSGRRRD